MKICIFSDSHGNSVLMKEAVRREQPDFVFFLGDGEQDLKALQKAFPGLPAEAVRGNCDLYSELPAEKVCRLENVCFFVTHGHRYGVKYDRRLEALKEAARQKKAQVVLFGHTHDFHLEQDGDLLLLNPGTARGYSATYAVLELDASGIHPRIEGF